MITSRLMPKAQTTIPQAVQTALGLKEGDDLTYVVEGDRVVLMKAQTVPTEDPFVTFTEWGSAADQQAYADL